MLLVQLCQVSCPWGSVFEVDEVVDEVVMRYLSQRQLKGKVLFCYNAYTYVLYTKFGAGSLAVLLSGNENIEHISAGVQSMNLKFPTNWNLTVLTGSYSIFMVVLHSSGISCASIKKLDGHSASADLHLGQYLTLLWYAKMQPQTIYIWIYFQWSHNISTLAMFCHD